MISGSLINSASLTISLARNNLTHVPGGSFTGFAPINVNSTYIYIDLSENSISKIENNAFIGLENMYLEIDIIENKLTEIPLALLVLNQLRHIDLSFNPIKVLDTVVLRHMAPTLKYFYIDIGNLSWPTELSSFTELQGVGFNDVHQSKLPLRLFHGSENKLINIMIVGSDLTMLPCSLTDHRVLAELTLHQSPNLSAKNMVEICRPNYTMSSTLIRLHIVNGTLTEFPNILKYTPMLTLLNLYGNQIQDVNEDFIPLNNKLTQLMLSYNRLKTVPNSFLRFQFLAFLILDNNNIATVAPSLERIGLLYSLCLRDNPVNATTLTVKCSSSRDSWAPGYNF